MTSNLGSHEIQKTTESGEFGFGGVTKTNLEQTQKIESIGTRAARKKFTPEFMNRIDRVVTFVPFTDEDYRNILTIELRKFQKEIFNALINFVFTVTERVMEFILEQLIDKEYGARSLKRIVHNILDIPITNLLNTGQVRAGDWISIDYEGQLSFKIEGRNLSFSAMHEVASLTSPQPDNASRYKTVGSKKR